MRTFRTAFTGIVASMLLLALVGTVLAQDEEAASVEDPMGPAFFTILEDLGDSVVASDPRMSGTIVEGDWTNTEIPGGMGAHSGHVRIENEAGAWDGQTSGFAWDDGAQWHEQFWFEGEGAYEGLSAVQVGQWCPGEGLSVYGLIFEGDVPPLWEPPAE